MAGELVLVTGGSGFIGAHCIRRLFEDGYRVRTTVRSLDREREVRDMAGDGALEFAVADLSDDTGWGDAVAGCDYVLHVASPFPLGQPEHENDLIVPARDGALRVLRAASEAGVRRVVQTSSFAAIGYGHSSPDAVSDETRWTDVDGPGVSAYAKSKTLAERAAWDFVAEQDGMELVAVNPVAVLGPPLGRDLSTSIEIVRRLMDGSMPGTPKVAFGLVDVRDVADLHVRAMTAPEAGGERFLAIGEDFRWISEMGAWLREVLPPDRAKKVPKRELPNALVKLASRFDGSLRQLVPELGVRKRATNEKARRVLGWAPRSDREAVVATAERLIELGIV